jgi:hypothetical protein
LVTAGFMTTCMAGLLIAPFIYTDKRANISPKALVLSFFLVAGLLIMQFDRISSLHDFNLIKFSIGLAIAAAFLWPLGNRMLLLKLEQRNLILDPMQRVLAMTIGSLPVLIGLAIYGYLTSGAPSAMQVKSSFIAVLISGVCGTIIFFKALKTASPNQWVLATAEATQVTGVFFTMLGEIMIKGTKWPGFYGNLGFLIMAASLAIYGWLCFKTESYSQAN